MKRENKIIKTFILLTLLAVASCASTPKTEQTTKRGPASMQSQTPMAWGKTIAPESEDFLEDVENAPARSY